METARVILERGGAVGIFPEGTRVRPGPLGEPKRGVGRLVLETGRPGRPGRGPRHRGLRRGLADPARPRDRPLRARADLPSATRPRAAPVGWRRRSPTASGRASRSSGSGSAACSRSAIAVVVGAGSWGTAVATLLARVGRHRAAGLPHSRAGARHRHDPRRTTAYLPGRRAARGRTGQDRSERALGRGRPRVPGRALAGARGRARVRRARGMPAARRRARALEGPRRARRHAADGARAGARRRAAGRVPRRARACRRGGAAPARR